MEKLNMLFQKQSQKHKLTIIFKFDYFFVFLFVVLLVSIFFLIFNSNISNFILHYFINKFNIKVVNI